MDRKEGSNTPPTSRIGFMDGEFTVPDDFDQMYADEIVALFEADNLFPPDENATMDGGDQTTVQRPLTRSERQLVEFLLRLAGQEGMHDLDNADVQAMDDSGMGSLQFGASREGRLGHMVAEAEFVDDDGLPVFASLVLDQSGSLYELDLWKVDFSPLKRIPEPSSLKAAG